MGEPDLEKGVPKNPDGEYTIDDGNSKNVENAHSLDPTPNLAELQESQTPPQTPQSSRSAGFTTGEKEIGFREDAKVWHLYLEDAEEKAKYKADLWNTALDSLLIFAGLFAGVVSSFVIDGRQDLHRDGEAGISTGINTAYWVSSLWIVSLFATIFSAIMGVLAKAWLAKYAPAKTRHEAADAYGRYQLEWQLKRWHFQEVLALIPLLVQLASVLFLAGLVVQLFGDSARTGWTLLSFCVVGGGVYCFMTVYPLVDSSAPFNTPLSELWKAFLSSPNPIGTTTYQTDINKGLYDIFYTKLVLSPKSEYVEEAIAEMALPNFKREWTDILCKGNTPEIVLAHFQKCATSRTIEPVRRDERLRNHLLALFSFVELYELKLTEAPTAAAVKEYRRLDSALRKSLQPGSPLHRWNAVPESLRPLLFALRTNILVLPGSCHPTSKSSGETPPDFHLNELLDRPWEMTLQEIRPSHCAPFMLAACRGLLHGGPHLRTVCSSILTLSLAKAASMASETGGEWTSGLSNKQDMDVRGLAMRYLSLLYQSTVNGWVSKLAEDGMVVDASVTGPPDARAHQLRNNIFGLWRQNPALGVHATRILKHASSADSPMLFSQLVTDSVVNMANLAVYGNPDGQEGGLELLIELSNVDDEMSGSINDVLKDRVRLAFGLEQGDGPGIAAAKFVETLASQIEGESHRLFGVVDAILPTLIEVALEENRSERIRLSAVQLLQCLSSKGWIDVKAAICNHLNKFLGSHEFRHRYSFLEKLQQLLKAKASTKDSKKASGTQLGLFPLAYLWDGSEGFIQHLMAQLLKELFKVAIQDSDSDVSASARGVLDLVSKDGRFGSLPPGWLKQLAEFTQASSRPRTRLNAIMVTGIFATSKRTNVTSELLEMLLKLALRDSEDDVRTAALELVSRILWDGDTIIAKDTKEATVEKSLEEIIPLETSNLLRNRWTAILVEIAKHVSFPEILPFVMRRAMVPEPDRVTQKIIIDFLGSKEFAEDPQCYKALEKYIPENLVVDLSKIEDVQTKRAWTKVLAELLQKEPLKELATKALSPVKDGMQILLNSKIGVTSGGSTECTYLSKSTVTATLRRALEKSRAANRMHCADALAVLTGIFPQDFPDAVDIILAMAAYDGDRAVRHGTLQSLRQLANIDPTRQDLLKGVLANVDQFAQDGNWKVRFALTQLLGILAWSNEPDLRKVTEKLVQMALNDDDHNVRSESHYTLVILVTDAVRRSPKMSQVLAECLIRVKDRHWKLRQSLVKCLAPLLSDTYSSLVEDVYKISINDGDSRVRDAALETLKQLLKGEDSKLRDSMASKLWKPVLSTLAELDPSRLSTSVFAKLTLPKLEVGQQQAPGHDTWTRIIVLLQRNGHKGVSKLIEWGLKEVSASRFEQLGQLFQDVELPDPVGKALPRYIDSALNIDTDATPQIRAVALDLVGRLTGAAKDMADYKGVLGEDGDPQIVWRLADISIRGADADLRKNALKLLKSLFKQSNADDRFSSLVKTSLTKAVNSCFEKPELLRYRSNAISLLHGLTEPSINNHCERFKDIVSPTLSHLLKLTLLATDKEQEEVRKLSEDLLIGNLTAYTIETKLNRDVLAAIITMIPTITFEGRRIAFHLARSLKISHDTLTSITSSLASLLRTTTSSFARETALEFLSKLYSADRLTQLKPRLIESAIPDIIALALDEKDDVGGIRTTAIRLLVALLSAAKNTDQQGSSASRPEVITRITPLATRFLGLLQNENLRPSVVALLSLMATQTAVRKTIFLQIMALAFGKDHDSESLHGHAELLARLILDGRFLDEPIDKVMLLLASVIVAKPKLAPHRFEVLTALWCRYRSKSITSDRPVVENDLVNWFALALFGRDATASEIDDWVKRCTAWLPGESKAGGGEEGGEIGKHDGKLAAKGASVNIVEVSSDVQEVPQSDRGEDVKAAHPG